MKKIILYTILTTALIFGNSIQANAQCKKFTKKICLPTLAPFTYNGQLNSAILAEGDVAELLLTFHKNQKYRVSVCNQEMIGDVQFKIFDTKKNLVFDKAKSTDKSYWDFISKSTQQLIIQITVPEEMPKDEITKTGCVTIIVFGGAENKVKRSGSRQFNPNKFKKIQNPCLPEVMELDRFDFLLTFFAKRLPT